MIEIRRYQIILGALLLAGCGPSGIPRYDISGAVTFQGRPVPAGRTCFEPDAAAGNTGPTTYANISGGNYRTLPGQGVVGGPHKVIVTGTDGVPFDMGSGTKNPQGKPLFADYSTTIDLPKKTHKHDIAVPAP